MNAEVKTRIVWIEDEEGWRDALTDTFQRGFKREGVSFEARADFKQLRKELEGMETDLAGAYILDNEIAGEFDCGAQMALRIRKRAIELEKDVLIVTMLCSNPGWVINHYGDAFGERGIPVFDKISDSMICGFYIGRCLRSGENMSLRDWIEEQGLVLPKGDAVNSHLARGIRSLPEGGFYQDISKLIASHPASFVSPYQDSQERMLADMGKILPGQFSAK